MSVGPGQTALTVTPLVPTSCATEAVSATTPAFDAQYEALPGAGLCANCEAAVATLQHVRQRVLHTEKDAAQIDVHHLRPFVDRFGLERSVMAAGTRVVDQDVETPEPIDHGLDRRFHLDFVAYVHTQGQRIPAQRCDIRQERLAFVLSSEIRNCDSGAFAGEEPADFTADAGVTADYQRRLVLQPVHLTLQNVLSC